MSRALLTASPNGRFQRHKAGLLTPIARNTCQVKCHDTSDCPRFFHRVKTTDTLIDKSVAVQGQVGKEAAVCRSAACQSSVVDQWPSIVRVPR